MQFIIQQSNSQTLSLTMSSNEIMPITKTTINFQMFHENLRKQIFKMNDVKNCRALSASMLKIYVQDVPFVCNPIDVNRKILHSSWCFWASVQQELCSTFRIKQIYQVLLVHDFHRIEKIFLFRFVYIRLFFICCIIQCFE